MNNATNLQKGRKLKYTSQAIASINVDKMSYIELRAKRYEWSSAKVISKVIDFWLALGAPPLAEFEDIKTIPPPPPQASVPVANNWKPYLPE